VVHVSDGDSLVVSLDGEDERVRLIGVNTPESDECFGSEATAILAGLVSDRQVAVVTDIEPLDQYGRILAYVYLDDVLINAEIVRRGAALARAYAPNVTLQDTLDAAEQQAQSSQSGLWSPTACGSGAVYAGAIVIVDVNADAPGRDDENLNGETLTIENQSADPIDLEGWTIKDESSVHRYAFGSITIGPGQSIVLFTGCGTDTTSTLYWCAATPVWDNAGDTAFLLEPSGAIVDLFEY